MNQITRLKPLFHPGRLFVTPTALVALRANGVPVISVLLRHIAGDWGVVSDDDRQQNDLSVDAGLRLISLYRLPDSAIVLVATEWDRSSTVIQLIDGNPPAPQLPHVFHSVRSRHSMPQMPGSFVGACA
jgi:hypothetical protein